jgi:hypothetical protein
MLRFEVTQGAAVLNGGLIKQRLSQYAAAWVLTFLVVLVGALGAHYGFGADVIAVSDAVLPAAFAVLGLLVVGFLIVTLFDRQTIATHVVVVIAAVLLVLPLLWSPVLAVICTAWIADVSIEYSVAYAQFRITISELIYPLSEFLFGPAISTAWAVFQGLATVVGFLSALGQVWAMVQRFTAGPAVPVSHDPA